MILLRRSVAINRRASSFVFDRRWQHGASGYSAAPSADDGSCNARALFSLVRASCFATLGVGLSNRVVGGARTHVPGKDIIYYYRCFSDDCTISIEVMTWNETKMLLYRQWEKIEKSKNIITFMRNNLRTAILSRNDGDANWWTTADRLPTCARRLITILYNNIHHSRPCPMTTPPMTQPELSCGCSW